MIIAVDAMGGDKAPQVTVEGAVLAAAELDVTIALVGNKDIIDSLLARHRSQHLRGSIVVVNAPDVIGMSESPSTVLRKKKNSSISVALEMVTMTMVAGRIMMKDRVLLTLDEERIAARARELSEQVWKRYRAQF